MESESIHTLLRERILVLDGSMGTMIQQYKLAEEDYRGDRFKDHPVALKGNNDLLSITRPDVIKEIHGKYLDAGADILSTNTFNANAISMADYKVEEIVYELNKASVQVAREAVEEYSAGGPDAPVGRSGSPLYSDMEQGKQPRDFNMLTAKLLRAMDIGTYKS